jgi:hypothetical protein
MKIEDYVLHKTLGHAGKVVEFGQQLVDGNYLLTLKVRLSSSGVMVESGV